MCNFSHLHVHTDASRIDGLGPVEKLVLSAANKGFKHLAITDHGTLANVIAFDNACSYNKIKPILGLEGYIKEAGNIYHITLLAGGDRGFDNLVNLNNIGIKSGGNRPAFTIQNLLNYSDDVIVLSGCPSSPLQELQWNDAKRIAIKLKDKFQDRFFSELMFVVESIPSWERSLQLAKDLNLNLVLTNDVHYAEKEYAPVHKVLTSLKSGFEYDDTHLWLAQSDDMISRLDDFGLSVYKPQLLEAMENAYNLADKIKTVKLADEPKLPHIENADLELTHFVNVGYSAKPELCEDDTYEKRLNYELATIQDMNFSSYFLILKDIVDYARNANIRVGVRGSGVASLVLYLLGITELDPIEHKLSFERFLNPKRIEMPDVDVDIDNVFRDSVIEYAAKKWGGIPVATYGHYDERSLIRELVKYFKGTKEQENNAADEGVNGKTFKELETVNPLIKLCYDVMLDQIKYTGKHPGGFVITDKNVPIELDKEGNILAAWTEGVENKELAYAGIVKFDLLGLKAHSILSILEKKHGKAIEPEDNHELFKMFHTGNTTGIFQFSGSPGIVNYTKMVKPTRFDDLVAINALYRPGALDAGTAQMYPEWKKKPRKLHPLIDDILEDTYGIICFQEQFMEIYARVTDGDLADADFARKVIVKNKESELPTLKDNFINGCLNHGIDEKLANKIWSEVAAHSRYSFNKAHSASYSYVAWQMAYFKYYHPVDYYAALLTIHPENANEYIFNAVMENIDIVMPDVNNSTEGYESDGNKIYMPLSAVYGLSGSGTDAILECKPFSSLEDFIERVPKRKVNKRARKGLYALGAFETIINGHSIKDQYSILAIDEVTEKTNEQKQLTYLGYTIPTKNLMESIHKYSKMGLLAGVIVSKEQAKSKYDGRKFTRFRLMPDGFCWARGSYENLEVGQKVAVKVNNYNNILRVYELD